MSEKVIVMAIGSTGDGKSQLGNGVLQKEVFEVSSLPESTTFITSSQSNIVNGIERVFIDTQGISSSDGKDAIYIQQMVKFLKDWKEGINACFIVINVQAPRFDEKMQLMFRIINDFFNNPDFWNNTGIVFTR